MLWVERAGCVTGEDWDERVATVTFATSWPTCSSAEGSMISFSQVLGNADEKHIAQGATSQEDKDGNDAADALAVAAARSHAPPPDLPRRAQERLTTTKAIHKMMLSILDVRF